MESTINLEHQHTQLHNGAQVLVRCLEAHGVQQIFGLPGEENLDLVEALRTSSIELIVTRNEQTAVFMAATYGRLTWLPWVALATLWPWATNMMTWVAYAQLWAMPLIVLTGQKPLRFSKQAKFQIIDVCAMMKPITKLTRSIAEWAQIPSLVAQAFALAQEERPGVVHLELPEDIAALPVDSVYASPIIGEKIRRPIPDEKSMSLLMTTIVQANHPLIVVGAWANRKRISKYLTAWIQKNNIPFFTSQMGKGVVDERLPQYIWTAALTDHDTLHKAIRCADLIIAIWHDTIEKPTHNLFTTKTKLIHINFSPADYDTLYAPSLQVIGDIGNTMRQLSQADFSDAWRDHTPIYEAARQHLASIDHNPTTPTNSTNSTNSTSHSVEPRWLIHHLRSILEPDDILALDNGLFKVWFARNYRCYRPNTLLLDNALATMGAWYASALTAKMLYPDRRVIAVVGDGWLVMNLGDLQTAVASWVALTILILNDHAYGMIKWKQHELGHHEFGMDLQNPDFVLLAQAFGAQGYRVETIETLQQTILQAEAQPWIKLIDIRFAYPPSFTL
jgi:acetolactate synthase I/II/III large subunit